jgi:pyruvate kinase
MHSLFIPCHASRSDLHTNHCFTTKTKPDFLAASFVRRAEDVIKIQQVLKDNGGEGIHIVSKIENQEGMENYEEILKVTDAVMVARGDLGMEVSLVPRVIFHATFTNHSRLQFRFFSASSLFINSFLGRFHRKKYFWLKR